jgi:hypothetical protein
MVLALSPSHLQEDRAVLFLVPLLLRLVLFLMFGLQ